MTFRKIYKLLVKWSRQQERAIRTGDKEKIEKSSLILKNLAEKLEKL